MSNHESSQRLPSSSFPEAVSQEGSIAQQRNGQSPQSPSGTEQEDINGRVDLATQMEELLFEAEDAQIWRACRRADNRPPNGKDHHVLSPLEQVKVETACLGPVEFSRHGKERSAQRNLSGEDLSYVLKFGTWIRRTGVDIVHLRRKDIPDQHRRSDEVSGLEGTTVVLTTGGSVATCYRNSNKRALRMIFKKSNRIEKEEKVRANIKCY